MMNKRLILILVIMLVIGSSMGMLVQDVQGSAGQKGFKQLTANRLVSYHPRISPSQAVNIALNAHKKAIVLSVKRYQSTYTIRLKTFWGKRTVKVGANTGRILYDRLDWTSKSK
jgi:uncharacterized membrane protein YkoI